jgi:hypothetical protein
VLLEVVGGGGGKDTQMDTLTRYHKVAFIHKIKENMLNHNHCTSHTYTAMQTAKIFTVIA